jgi:gas vesicle structural protein
MSSVSVTRRPASGTLAEVVDIILDKGLVIDAYVRISVVGIELLTIDIRVVVASVDTYLHFAEATNRLDLRGQAEEYDDSLQDVAGAIGDDS